MAGYAANSAHRSYQQILDRPRVQAAIALLQHAAGRAALVTRDRVVAGYAEIAWSAEEPAGVRLKALDSLSRVLGFDQPKRVEVGPAGAFAKLTDTELDAEIARLDRIIDVTPQGEKKA